MPRLGNLVPKHRKHKQSGQAIVTINGRDHLLGPRGTKARKLEYDRLVTEWLSSVRSSSHGMPEQVVSVVELVVAYPYARLPEFNVRASYESDASSKPNPIPVILDEASHGRISPGLSR